MAIKIMLITENTIKEYKSLKNKQINITSKKTTM